MSKVKIKHQPHLEALFPYPAGKPIEEVQREYGITSIVKLASNENLFGPSKKAIAAAKKAMTDVNFYPEGGAYYLRQKLAKKMRLKPEQFIFGNGTDELIILMALTFLGPDELMIISDKSFVRYRMAALLNNSPFKMVPMRYSEPKKNEICWKHDLDGMLKAVTKKTKMICISNPNNPLGTWVEKNELEAFLKKVPDHVIVFYDEAYYEYAKGTKGYPNGSQYLKQYPNLIVSRSFSKSYGLAGFRVGYCMATPDLIQSVERIRPPFNVNRVAQAAALGALDDHEHLDKTIKFTREGLKYLQKEVSQLGLKYLPSRANFLTIDLGEQATDICKKLLYEGVIVRPLAGFGLPNLIRVTIGKTPENKKFIQKLKKLL